MELGPRDRLSQAFVHESEKGRTDQTAVRRRRLPRPAASRRRSSSTTQLPFVRELCLKYENIDPVHELIPVRPVVHYMMGGVHTDIDGATPLRGLYAAGETACVSINGANRLGSNSLPECLVFGARAGRAAAEFASAPAPTPPSSRRRRADEERRLERDLFGKGRRRESRSPTIRDEMQTTMEESAGIYRTGDVAGEGRGHAARAAGARRRTSRSRTTSRSFNTELVAALELANMLDIAECIVQCAAVARGVARRPPAHRLPGRDDERFLAHSLVSRDADGTARVEQPSGHHHPLAPGKRVYGQVALMADQHRPAGSRYRPGRRPSPLRRSTTSRCAKELTVLDGLNTSRTRWTAPCRSAGRAGWASAAAAA